MPKESAPYFPFYASDYLSDLNVQCMSLEEEGCYVRLMAYAWREKGIPSDIEELTKLCKGITPTKRVLGCFDYPSMNNTSMYHPRLEFERQKFEKKRKSSAKGGRNSASKRKHIKKKDPEQYTGVLLPSEGQVKGNLSLSLSSSISNSNIPPKSPPRGNGKVKESKTKYYSSQALELAEILKRKIIERDPNAHAAKNGAAERWAVDIDKIIRIDKRPYEDIARVISWCQNDSFWCSNILSGKKLRDKFDALYGRMNAEAGKGQRSTEDLMADKSILPEIGDE